MGCRDEKCSLLINPNRSLEFFLCKKSDYSRLCHRYSICMLTQYADFALFQDKMKANFSNDRFRIKRCRAGRFSLLFVVQQSFRTIGSLGCVGCSIALCLSSQRNAIGFPARCVCHRSLSRLSSQSVLFGVVSFCGVSCSCFLVDLFLCLLVCVGMLSSRGLLSVRLAAS